MMDSDRALSLLGKCSRWKLGLYFLSSLFTGFLAGWHMLVIVFLGMEPSYHCKLPEGVSVNESIPTVTKDGITALDKCSIWSDYNSDSNSTTPCPDGWEYDNSLLTIVNEWDLVCDNSYLVETSQTILVAGVMLGGLITAILADRFGRKTIFVSSVIGISIVGLFTSFVGHYTAFAVARFITGFLQQGVVLSGFVYAIELFPASQRTEAGMYCQCFWAVGMGILALFAWAFPNWRHILLCLAVPGLLGIALIWVLPESLPWLCAKNKTVQAKQVLKTAARISKVTLPADLQMTKEEEFKLEETENKSIMEKIKEFFGECCAKEEVVSKDKASRYTIMDVIRSRRLLSFAIINTYLWCANSLIYYGLSLSTGSLAGNPYLNFFLSGLVEIPAYIISTYALKYIGRRWSIFAFHIVAGVSLFLTLFIPVQTANGTDLSPLILTLSMIGKFGITGSFGSIFLFAPELFPTTIRNIGLGIASIGGRIGNVIAPFSSFVAKRVWWLPNVVFGVMAILAAFLTLILPETLNRPLPETIEEVEGWSRTISKEQRHRFKAEQKAKRAMVNMHLNGHENGSAKEPLNTAEA